MKENAEVFNTLAPIKYDVNLAAIAKLREEYMPLEITDLKDKEQFDSVHAARMVMVKVRTSIEKERVTQKAEALQHGRDVDAAANVLFDESGPIETHLQTEEKKVTDEEKRIKEEELRQFRVVVEERVNALLLCGVALPFDEVAGWTDDKYDAEITRVEEEFKAEEQRKAEEEKERAGKQAELDRQIEEQRKRDKEAVAKDEALRIEREAFEKEKRELVEQKRIAREQSLREIGVFRAGIAGESLTSKFVDFQYSGPPIPWAAIVDMSDDGFAEVREDLKTQITKFEVETLLRVRIQAEQDAKDELVQKEFEAEEKKAEEERKKALLPDKEKLVAWAESIASLVVPEVQDATAKVIVENGELALISIAEHITTKAEEM
ncbi:hypothetical protein ES708_00730 [subsurface metagenome]